MKPPSKVKDVDESPRAARTFEVRARDLTLGLTVVLVALLVGAGCYFIGKGSGEDLDRARASGAAAGAKAGASKGKLKGHAAGLKAGTKQGFARTYGPAYKKAYARVFRDAGLDAPSKREIEVPRA